MERLDLSRISDIILNAPAWTRDGLTVRDQRLRAQAADALAATIVQRLNEHVTAVDRNQLTLAL